ncbi:MAG: hypothetical protein JRE65_03320 [Deltaproteobacteria bacterium]|nr:hypothetical protein [Deltaproteobacteria bacterium]
MTNISQTTPKSQNLEAITSLRNKFRVQGARREVLQKRNLPSSMADEHFEAFYNAAMGKFGVDIDSNTQHI